MSNRHRPWTEEEDAHLIALYEVGVSHRVMEAACRRSGAAVDNRINLHIKEGRIERRGGPKPHASHAPYGGTMPRFMDEQELAELYQGRRYGCRSDEPQSDLQSLMTT